MHEPWWSQLLLQKEALWMRVHRNRKTSTFSVKKKKSENTLCHEISINNRSVNFLCQKKVTSSKNVRCLLIISQEENAGQQYFSVGGHAFAHFINCILLCFTFLLFLLNEKGKGWPTVRGELWSIYLFTCDHHSFFFFSFFFFIFLFWIEITIAINSLRFERNQCFK